MSEHPLDNQLISDERICPQCDYPLHGLREGGVCPECGRAIKPKTKSGRFQDNLARAPMRYLRQLRLGLVLMSAAILSGVVPFVVLFITPGIALLMWVAAYFLAPVLWAAGVAIVAQRRRTTEHTSPDAILDGNKLRYAVMGIHTVPVLAGACLLFGSMVGGVLGVLVPVGLGLLLVTVFGCVPLGVYLSGLADWASDDKLGGRLRGSAWFITVFGTLTILLTLVAFTGSPFSGLAAIAAIWMLVFSVIALFVLMLGVVQLTVAANWAINNQVYADASRERADEKRRARTARPNVTIDRLCDGCGYDLEGLPLAGLCPECGTPFGDANDLAFVPRPEPASGGAGPVEYSDDPIPLEGDDAPAPAPGSLGEEILGQKPSQEIRHTPHSITRERGHVGGQPPPPPSQDAGI